MENQHRKIVGYRELTQEDIDLMNRIKAAGRDMLALQEEVTRRAQLQVEEAHARSAPDRDYPNRAEFESCQAEQARITQADPLRWADIAKTDFQTGVMALVRAVAQPTDC